MPEPIRHTLVHYIDEAGHDLFGDWLETLADVATRVAIAARLIRPVFCRVGLVWRQQGARGGTQRAAY